MSGSFAESVSSMAKAAKAIHKAAERASNRGRSALARGDVDLALKSFQQARKVAPLNFDACFGLARTLHAMGDLGGAVDAFEHALGTAPDDPRALIALGDLALKLDMPEQATGFFQIVARMEPGSADATLGLSRAMMLDDRFEEASGLVQSALQINSGAAALWNQMGLIRAEMEDWQNAETFLTEALRLEPENQQAHGNMADVLFATGRHAEALDAFVRAGSIGKANATLQFNHAMAALAMGDVKTGWKHYEARLNPSYTGHVRHDVPLKVWDGRKIAGGKGLAVIAEQGVGDEILMSHLAPFAAETAGGPIMWEADPRLLSLFRRSYPDIEFQPWQPGTKPGLARDHDGLKNRKDLSRYVQAASLLPLYAATANGITPKAEHLLKPDEQLLEKWQAKVRETGKGLRIGISWTSSLQNRLRNRGYVSLNELAPVLTLSGVQLFSLQYGDVEADITAVEDAFGVTIHRFDDLDLKDDFENTAALTACMDVVIGPTNTARQLAASLGVETMVLSRLPYELDLGQAQNPMFPHMQNVTRLPDPDWTAAIQRVAEMIKIHLQP